MAQPSDDDPVLFVSPAEAGRRLACSRATVYRLLSAGELTARKLGRRTLVEVASLRAYAERLDFWRPDSAA